MAGHGRSAHAELPRSQVLQGACQPHPYGRGPRPRGTLAAPARWEELRLMWTYREKVTYEVYDQETGYVTGHYDQEFEAAEAAHTINTYDRRAMDNAAAKKAQ